MAATTLVPLSAAVANNRFSAEFFDPQYVFRPKDPSTWLPIGRVLLKCEYGISVAMNTHGAGYPMFRMNELDNCLALRPEKHADIPAPLFEQYRLKRGDVLFNRTNSFEFVGRTGIVVDQTDCTFASYLIRLVPNSGMVLPEYLAVYLNTQFGIGQIRRRAMRSINQANVSGSEVRRILIHVAPSVVQQSIAAKVSDAFARLRESEALISNATQVIEEELDINVQEPRLTPGYIAGYHEAVASGRIDADYFQPQYRAVIKAVTQYLHGYDSLTAFADPLKPNIDPTATPTHVFDYIELSNINASLGRVEGKTQANGKSLPSRARRQVSAGDVIASAVVGSVDKVALISPAEDGYIASTGFFHFRPKTVSPEYLLMLVRSRCVSMQFQQQATGGILSAVPDGRLKYVIVPRFPQKLQDRITDLVAQAHQAKRESDALLERAKARVEQLIEEAIEP